MTSIIELIQADTGKAKLVMMKHQIKQNAKFRTMIQCKRKDEQNNICFVDDSHFERIRIKQPGTWELGDSCYSLLCPPKRKSNSIKCHEM